MSLDKKFLEAQMIYEKKISDLEAKLADKENDENFKDWVINDLTDKLKKSEEEKETLRISQSSTHKTMMQLNDELLKTQKKLAEKDKQLSEYSDINNALNSGLKDKCISCEEEHNQDKISFCIEKLEETKKNLRDKVCLMENDEHCYSQNAIHWQDVVAIIDNQIASLKKGVE